MGKAIGAMIGGLIGAILIFVVIFMPWMLAIRKRHTPPPALQ